jgi:hypothetical protein
MNFIKHFLSWMERVSADERLTPHHISLYIALFQYWNSNHFKNPISIAREETMGTSKIGSINTYVKCLKELHEWGYIKYDPSFNPMKGSKVHLYKFDKADDTGNDKADNTGSDKAGGQVVIPSINNTVNNTKTNTKREKGQTPALEQVLDFFLEKKYPTLEARKFFNHYQANGWKLGGKTEIQDWGAAAENWMLKTSNFNNHGLSMDHAKRNTNNGTKDYSEPL